MKKQRSLSGFPQTSISGSPLRPGPPAGPSTPRLSTAWRPSATPLRQMPNRPDGDSAFPALLRRSPIPPGLKARASSEESGENGQGCSSHHSLWCSTKWGVSRSVARVVSSGFPLVECADRVETSRRWLHVGGRSGILTHGHTSVCGEEPGKELSCEFHAPCPGRGEAVGHLGYRFEGAHPHGERPVCRRGRHPERLRQIPPGTPAGQYVHGRPVPTDRQEPAAATDRHPCRDIMPQLVSRDSRSSPFADS